MSVDVSVIGLGRIGLPLALCFADRGLRVLGIDNDPERLRAVGERRMPFKEPGTQELLDARRPRPPDAVGPRRRRRPGRAHRASPSARPRSRTSRSTCATSARCSTTCCRSCARGTRSSCARRSRPARPTSSPATCEKQRGLPDRRGHLRRPRARAHRRRPLHGGDRHAAVHRRRRRRALGRARGAAVRAARRADRADDAGAGRAGEDLDQHPALRDVRAAQPADDGLRALRGERLRRHRADQPRLPARRDEARRASPPARACARTSRSPRSARARPGMLLAVSRVNESVPLFLVEGIKRRLGGRCASAASPCSAWRSRRDTDDERDSLSHKLIRLLERELADVAVHDPRRGDAHLELRGGRRRRRRRHRGHEPHRYSAPEALRTIAELAGRRLPRRRSRGTRSARPRCSPTSPRSRRCGHEHARLGGVRRDVGHLGRPVPVHQGRGRRRRLAGASCPSRARARRRVLLALAWQAGALASLRGSWRWVAAYAVAEIALPFPLIAAGEQRVLLVAGGDPDRLRAAAGRAAGDPLRRCDRAASDWSASRIGASAVSGPSASTSRRQRSARPDERSAPLIVLAAAATRSAPMVAQPTSVADARRWWAPLAIAAVDARDPGRALGALGDAARRRAGVDRRRSGLVCTALAFVVFSVADPRGRPGPARSSSPYVNPVVAVALGVRDPRRAPGRGRGRRPAPDPGRLVAVHRRPRCPAGRLAARLENQSSGGLPCR